MGVTTSTNPGPGEFECGVCHGVFPASDDPVAVEAEHLVNFGTLPPRSERVDVCDGCYTEIMAWARKEGHVLNYEGKGEPGGG